MQKQFLAMLLILMYTPSVLACNTNDVPFAAGNSTKTQDGNCTIFDFWSNCTTGTAPLHTNFACNVSGNVTSYQWVFSPVCSDYFSKHQVTALHTFQTPGLYNVTLTVVEANGQKASMTKIGYINVTGYTQAPKVCTPKPCATKTQCKSFSKTITFKGKGFSTCNIKNVTWVYADGSKYTTKCLCVKHTFHKAGKQNVKVTVTYKNGKICSGNTTVNV